jgi:hypothetical protein
LLDALASDDLPHWITPSTALRAVVSRMPALPVSVMRRTPLPEPGHLIPCDYDALLREIGPADGEQLGHIQTIVAVHLHYFLEALQCTAGVT